MNTKTEEKQNDAGTARIARIALLADFLKEAVSELIGTEIDELVCIEEDTRGWFKVTYTKEVTIGGGGDIEQDVMQEFYDYVMPQELGLELVLKAGF